MTDTMAPPAAAETNPLLSREQPIPFDRIAPRHVVPATREALLAPLSGVIASSHVVLGQVVEARELVFEIVDPTRVLVEAIRAKKGKLTYGDLHERASATIRKKKFDQVPQLEGSKAFTKENDEAVDDERVEAPVEVGGFRQVPRERRHVRGG